MRIDIPNRVLFIAGVITIAVFLISGITAQINPNTDAYHLLQEIVRSENDLTSVDVDGDGVIDSADTLDSSCGENQVLKYVGGNWICEDDIVGGAGSCDCTGLVVGGGTSYSGVDCGQSPCNPWGSAYCSPSGHAGTLTCPEGSTRRLSGNSIWQTEYDPCNLPYYICVQD